MGFFVLSGLVENELCKNCFTMDKIALEKREADILNNIGYRFSVKYQVYEPIRNYPRILFWKKAELKRKERVEEFEIKPMTLSTLDRTAEYQLKIILNEEDLEDDAKALQVSKSIVKDNAKLLCTIIAHCILGNDFVMCLGDKKVKNLTELKRISSLLWSALTPIDLYQITVEIIGLSDYSNFINSTRWMSGKRTTQPNEVE